MRVIAISGKGGTGKTTIAALTIGWLAHNRTGATLAVDADPCLNLGDMLGVKVRETVGVIREEMKTRASSLPGGMSKHQFLEYKIQSSLVESSRFDLIAMGRPEGPGCYCYANNLLRDILDTLSKNYDHVVVDNEAGMEHISRRTTRNVDCLFMVSDPTVRGVRTAGKIGRLADQLDVRVREKGLIVNRVVGTLAGPVEETIRQEGLKHLCSIPEDNRLLSQDRAGRPIWPIQTDSVAYQALGRFLSELMSG
jgi:CO dehydrogenase maturation factor